MKKILLLLLAFLMLVTACDQKDFFELKRPPESPWLSLYEFERAPIGGYSLLFHGGWGVKFDYYNLYKNAIGDDAAWSTPGDAAWGWYRDTENEKGWLNEMFQGAYKTISSVNDALAFVEENDGNPFPKITAKDKTINLDRIIGELYFLRGFSYYMLMTTFGNAYVPGGPNNDQRLPLRLERSSSYEEASNSKLGTTEEMWNQILSDFQQAYDMLPERFVNGMHPSYEAGRANKFAAAMMLSRTYFAMGNYDKAGELAGFVIDQNNGDYDLSEDPIEAFNKSSFARGKEVIMYSPDWDETYGGRNLHASCFTHLFLSNPCNWTATHMDYTTLQRIGWMPDPKNDTTITIVARRDKRFQQVLAVREPNNVPEDERIEGRFYEPRAYMKWRSILGNKYFRGPLIGYTNTVILRLAEMYLTRSICLFKAGDKQGAADDLNVVRKRAWDETVAGVTYEASDSYVTSSNITEQMIGDERLIELFMEGDRIDYLRGLKVDIPNYEPERGVPALTPYTDDSFIWPIPVANEKDLNGAYN